MDELKVTHTIPKDQLINVVFGLLIEIHSNQQLINENIHALAQILPEDHKIKLKKLNDSSRQSLDLKLIRELQNSFGV